MLTHTRYNAICKLKYLINNSNIQNRYNSINCGQSKTRKSKMLINCSEMTVNYTVMHCNSDNKTRPNSAAYVVRLLPSEHTAAKKYYRKKYL